MQEEIFVACKGVSIGYKDQSNGLIAVKSDLSLKAVQGELVALIGGNGIGKSTLLKTIAGFQSPLSGDLLIHQKSISDYNPVELAKELGFVSTENVHVANLTVEEMVGLGRYPYTNWFGQLEERDHQIMGEAIRKVGLSGYEKRLINRISDGERQRAMIARALAQDTRIIILDEPTAFLDIANKYEIMHILHQLVNEEGKCVIFSTHDLNTALSMADRIWLMLGSEVVEGIPEELAYKGYFGSLFPGNTHLYFDEEKYDFRIKKEKVGTILLSADSQELNWISKALERIGFEVVIDAFLATNLTDSSSQISVIQQAGSWKLINGEHYNEVKSLEELCRELKRITPLLKS